MTIDRRTMLRRMGEAAAVGTIGASLVAAATPGRTPRHSDDRRPPGPPLRRPQSVAESAGQWAAVRPAIVPRSAWRTDPVSGQATALPSAPSVKAVFVHHTDSGNHYGRAEVPEMIQSFCTDHIESNDWDDIGYNFLVDRMGTVYEGRSGGVGNAVIGAHTKGFNIGTVGIAAIGSFGSGEDVPEPLLESLARLAAWKLGMYGVDARGDTVLTSSSDEARYRKGTRAVFHTISGHRDGYSTDCPGGALYGLLPAVRRRAFHLQGLAASPALRGCPVPPSFLLRAPT